jgi:polygalacturonase
MKRFFPLLLTIILVFGGTSRGAAGKDEKVSTGNVFNIADYGAVGDGVRKNTDAIKKAIEACVKAGGGTVRVPGGKFLTGPIELKSNITLHIEAGAHLLFSQDVNDYPTVQSRWYGTEQHGFMSCIFAKDSENITVTGRGVVDGQGEYWWKLFNQKSEERPERVRSRQAEFMRLTRERFGHDQTRFGRPSLVQFLNCRNVRIDGLKFVRSPFWVLHPIYCENVMIDAAMVVSPADSPNTDALDVDSCKNVLVSNSYFDVGDDCIVIKAGRDEDGRRVNRPSENITISNCVMARGHGGVVIGSEMSGGVRNVVVDNCVFTQTDRGIRLKSSRGRGGVVEDMRVNNIIMKDVVCPFTINMFYYNNVNNPKQPVNEGTPIFRDLHFSNITVKNTDFAGFFAGLPELPVEGITFSNVYIDTTKGRRWEEIGKPSGYSGSPAMAEGYERIEGFYCKNIKDIAFRNVRVNTKKCPVFVFENTEGLEIDGFRTATVDANRPVIELRQVKTALIDARGDTESDVPFIKISGSQTKNIQLSDMIKQKKGAVLIEADVSTDALTD